MSKISYCKFISIIALLGIILLHGSVYAEEEAEPLHPALSSLLQLHDKLQGDIVVVRKELKSSNSTVEKSELELSLKKLEKELRGIDSNIENVIAGTDISSLSHTQNQEFSFQKEFFELLKPALDEMKAMTVDVRKKTELRKKILHHNEQLPILEQAIANLEKVRAQTTDKNDLKTLDKISTAWKKQKSLIHSELQTAQVQLKNMMAEEVSLADASQSYLKSFFQKRGLYLLEAITAVIVIILMSRLGYVLMKRFIPGFNKLHRSFRVRLVELLYYLITIILVILGPMVVFYLGEDWVLFSLGIVLLLGIALTLRHAIPRYIHQIELFLNIGSVREGERIMLDGLPWKVNSINVYCSLENPDAGLSQRIHIDDLVDQKSRVSKDDEPWFPCKQGEWVILNTQFRGQVTAISLEMVELIERGGAKVTYQMSDFLAASPRNLSQGFRLKELVGISYDLQSSCTTAIPQQLSSFIEKHLIEEQYQEVLRSIKVEFGQMNNSSLDLVVIADFHGEAAELYGRLKRVIQRLSVDACSEYQWEIPFPQMTVHNSAGN